MHGCLLCEWLIVHVCLMCMSVCVLILCKRVGCMFVHVCMFDVYACACVSYMYIDVCACVCFSYVYM